MSDRRLSAWSWFVVWTVIGCAAGLASVSIQLLAAPVLLAAIALLAWRRAVRRSALGFVSGLGVAALIVAYIQRKGPGTVYWHTATASGADQYLDPRPWLAAGMVLVVGGVVAFAFLGRRAHHESHQPTGGGRRAG